jgi:hypothetical protein
MLDMILMLSMATIQQVGGFRRQPFTEIKMNDDVTFPRFGLLNDAFKPILSPRPFGSIPIIDLADRLLR